MKLNIKDFLNSSDSEFDFSGELETQNTDYDISDLNLIFPIKFHGRILNLSSQILLDLDIVYRYNTQCDRCLKPLTNEEKSHLNACIVFDSKDSYEDEASMQYFELKDGEVFLDEIIISQVITSMPFKNLCDETCKGLCQTCGKDLNEGLCDCQNNNDIDIRFEKLINLFNDEEV